MADVEHLLVAQAGTDERSRYVVMVGVRVDNLESLATRLITLGDTDVTDTLRELAFEIRIAFSSKQRLEGFGADWQYALLSEVVRDSFNARKSRTMGYPLVAHLPDGLSVESGWLDAYLTGATYGLVRVRTEVVHRDDDVLALPRLVARIFHEAIEDGVSRPSAARDRYDALALLVTHIEDVGLNVSYSRDGTAFESLVRMSLSSCFCARRSG
jgi:hypothetical protein